MPELCSKQDCTGCLACYNACAQGAIKLVKSEEGFVYPEIDQSKCVSCGMCAKACPILNKPERTRIEQECFAAYVKDNELRKKSSSGGMFSAFAERTIKEGGFVAGACLDDDFNVKHIVADNEAGLAKLRGSKYVQSFIGNIYKEVKEKLKTGKPVLFTGTPCQVAGLYGFLHKDYSNLTTIDIVCHGAPSPLMFGEYKNWLQKKYESRITDFQFRDKKWSWHFYNMKVSFKNGKTYFGKYGEDIYIRGFLRDYFLRPNCNACRFANMERMGDLTISDFWGFRQSKNLKDTDEGISACIVNTENGRKAFESVRNGLNFALRPVDEAKRGNLCLNKPFKKSPLRDQFWADYKEYGYEYCIPKYFYLDKNNLQTKAAYLFGYGGKTFKLAGKLLKVTRIPYKLKSVVPVYKDKLYFRGLQWKLIENIRKTGVKKIFLICAPSHSNLGDQAQLLCWHKYFKENYPDYKLIDVPSRAVENHLLPNRIHKPAPLTQNKVLNLLERNIGKNDLLFIHSGYLIYDIHPELPLITEIVRRFKNRQVVILPQTVNLAIDKMIGATEQIFNAHPELTLFCRDEVSFENAQKMYPKCHNVLMPDVVTSLIGNKDFSCSGQKRNGILFCLRNDGEKFYSDSGIKNLRDKLSAYYQKAMDTTIVADVKEWNINREKLIRGMLEKFARFQLIITDRYHGTIFSQIVNTPVIVINSADHKLSSGVKWFPKDVFGRNMNYAKNLDEAYLIAVSILSENGPVIENPPYFKEKFFNGKFGDIQ